MVRYLNLTGGELIRKVTKNFQRMVDGQTAVCQGVVESQLIAAHLHKNTFCYSWCNLASQFCSACSCFWSALDAFICQFSWQCSRGAQLLECLTSWVSFFFFFQASNPREISAICHLFAMIQVSSSEHSTLPEEFSPQGKSSCVCMYLSDLPFYFYF